MKAEFLSLRKYLKTVHFAVDLDISHKKLKLFLLHLFVINNLVDPQSLKVWVRDKLQFVTTQLGRVPILLNRPVGE